MLKCGQKDNLNYTFGISKAQIKEAEDKIICACSKCGKTFNRKVNFCSICGEKIG